MAESNAEEEVYQLYTVIDDLVFDESEHSHSIETPTDNDQIIYVTVDASDDNHGQYLNDVDQNEFSENSNLVEDNALPVCNLKFVTLTDGQFFLAADDLSEDNLESIQPQLLTLSGEATSKELIEKFDDADDLMSDDEDYHEVSLLDGSTALLPANLFKLIKTNKKVTHELVNPKSKRKGGFICTYLDCGKTFTSGHHLSVHTRLHTGSRPYSCGVPGCTKTFVTNYSLKAHTRTHTGEKPYGCSVCIKCFKTAGDLQKHIRTHTGEKPFSCPIEGCDKSFSTSNIRKVHVRSHTGERPYICTVSNCGKAFSSATNYKNHIRIHSGEKPYCCSVEGCGKRFTEYSSLYKHKVVHDPVKLQKCTYDGCYQIFKSEGLLKHHKRMMHNVLYISETSANYLLQPKEEKPFIVSQLTEFD